MSGVEDQDESLIDPGSQVSTPTPEQMPTEHEQGTKSNLVGEVTSLLSSLYRFDPDENEKSLAEEMSQAYLALPFKAFTNDLGH